MIKLYDGGVYLLRGRQIIPADEGAPARVEAALGRKVPQEEAAGGTIARAVLARHNNGDEKNLRLKFDSLTAHDITSVGIVLTARASGLTEFPVPMVMTNCHNSLCAVGGTINEDDHVFALSAAQKYGGVYVPPNMAVIHTYNREMMAGCGRMILGSDSHTRYGALGTMAVGEGGGELVKQLLGRTYDMPRPETVAVYLSGRPNECVGPHDVALAIISAVFKNGYVKNKIMEFVGDGIAGLPVEFRNGIDVMTTETTCWSSIWETDAAVSDYLASHGRADAFAPLAPAEAAYYDGMIYVDLSKIEPMIALPFHPGNAYAIRDFKSNAGDILRGIEADPACLLSKLRDGEFLTEQGVICGCAGGTFDNIAAASAILGDNPIVGSFSLSVYPESMPACIGLTRAGVAERLMRVGAVMKPAFCGPCFGAGDTPSNGGFSVRHTTRNFPNREGSKSDEGQRAYVALMDSRSIAATALNGGMLTSAAEVRPGGAIPRYFFDKSVYSARVFDGTGRANGSIELVFGPNIKEWPEIPALEEDLLLRVVSYITDPVTTTDELIPSGETSSFRSNPLRLAEYTLSRRDPQYRERAKAVRALEEARRAGASPEADEDTARAFAKLREVKEFASLEAGKIGLGSTIFARKPGDGSAREQAASCQRVLGASANIALEYATKRYRSNLINWGILPLLVRDEGAFANGDFIFLPGIRRAIENRADKITAYAIAAEARPLELTLGDLTPDERAILISGCLINYYKSKA